MGTAGRSAPLRRAGSLLGLLGLELGAVLALHWLGRFPGLRIRWDQPVPWVLSSPVQDVLGAVLRTVGLVMAYWLLASTVLYLLASLTRLPSAVRAVGWATLPLARRVADHAVAVTLATSMVGGTTLGVAGPALAADRGDGMGPPARKPVAAAQATTTTVYGFGPAGPDAADQATSSTAAETTTTTKPSTKTTDTSSTTTSASSTTTTSESTTTTATTEPSTTATTQAPTTTTEPPTTTERSTTTTTAPSAARPAPPAYKFEGAGQEAPPSTTAAPASSAATTTSTTGLRPPAYEFTPPPAPGAREAPGDAGSGGGGDQGGGSSGGGGSGGGGSGGGSSGGGSSGGEEPSGTAQEQAYRVQRGDNLWTIARDHLRSARSGGSGEPTNREVGEYWAKVVEANRNGLRSGDPDLIYPDEKIDLPPTD